MSNHLVHVASFLIIVLAGCSTESELRKSIFIRDKENPDLPIYSEWGYNTFGAYYDRTPFTSSHATTPAKFIVRNEVASFRLEGERQPDQYYSKENVALEFILPGILPTDYKDLISLHQTSFDLTQAEVNMRITINQQEVAAHILEGNLRFVRAQNLLVDKQQMQVILSGRFECKVVINGIPVSISDGRFDVGISEKNFFHF